jgi:hypothetical protein
MRLVRQTKQISPKIEEARTDAALRELFQIFIAR